jgi:hypothetical protein
MQAFIVHQASAVFAVHEDLDLKEVDFWNRGSV